MKISNKVFYKQHSIELERYLIGQKTLHVINESSKDKILEDVSRKTIHLPFFYRAPVS